MCAGPCLVTSKPLIKGQENQNWKSSQNWDPAGKAAPGLHCASCLLSLACLPQLCVWGRTSQGNSPEREEESSGLCYMWLGNMQYACVKLYYSKKHIAVNSYQNTFNCLEHIYAIAFATE